MSEQKQFIETKNTDILSGDYFLQDLYQYWKSAGLLPYITQQLSSLFVLVFVECMAIVLFGFVSITNSGIH